MLSFTQTTTRSLTITDTAVRQSEAGQFTPIIQQDQVDFSSLVGRLLELSRLQAGTLELQLEPCHLEDIIGAAMEDLEALCHNHRLAIEIAPDVLPVIACPQRVTQVLLALVDNAARFSPENGRILISAHRLGKSVQIDVCDQGCGIAPEDRASIFQAYCREQRPRGAGLSLAICKGLVEAQGGNIWVAERSRKGFKTTVSFTLPVLTAANRHLCQRPKSKKASVFTHDSLMQESYTSWI